MEEELLPDNSDQSSDENQTEKGNNGHRRRRRVRKRIRIKKKSNSSKKVKKIAEKIIWTLLIIGFIAALMIFVRELNVVDEKNKKVSPTSINTIYKIETFNSI